MATFLTNLYRKHAILSIDGEVILSQERTTQEGFIAMLPFIKRLRGHLKQF